MPTPILKLLGSICGSSQVPIGTPSSPGTTNGSTRPHSIARQTRGSVCTWETTEQTITSEAATGGEIAYSHNPMAVMPVPKPVRPLTMPAASAPRSTSAI